MFNSLLVDSDLIGTESGSEKIGQQRTMAGGHIYTVGQSLVIGQYANTGVIDAVLHITQHYQVCVG